jgi:hypothetical protein
MKIRKKIIYYIAPSITQNHFIIHFLTIECLCEARTQYSTLANDLLSLQSTILPPSAVRKDLKGGIKHNEQTNYINETELSGSSKNCQIFNSIDMLNLSPTPRSITCFLQELEVLSRSTIMNHGNASHSFGTKDSINISQGIQYQLLWQHWLNFMLQQFLFHRIDIWTALFQTPETYQAEIEPTISPIILMRRGVVGRQRQLYDFLRLQPSPILPNERSLHEERTKDYTLSRFFPVKLHRLLLDLDQAQGGGSIAYFVPKGNAFVIVDSHRFEKEVMKVYFPRMSNFTSFQRQLNHYKFRRICFGSSENAFWHPSFMREFPSMCIGIKRVKKKHKIGNVKARIF